MLLIETSMSPKHIMYASSSHVEIMKHMHVHHVNGICAWLTYLRAKYNNLHAAGIFYANSVKVKIW